MSQRKRQASPSNRRAVAVKHPPCCRTCVAGFLFALSTVYAAIIHPTITTAHESENETTMPSRRACTEPPRGVTAAGGGRGRE